MTDEEIKKLIELTDNPDPTLEDLATIAAMANVMAKDFQGLEHMMRVAHKIHDADRAKIRALESENAELRFGKGGRLVHRVRLLEHQCNLMAQDLAEPKEHPTPCLKCGMRHNRSKRCMKCLVEKYELAAELER